MYYLITIHNLLTYLIDQYLIGYLLIVKYVSAC